MRVECNVALDRTVEWHGRKEKSSLFDVGLCGSCDAGARRVTAAPRITIVAKVAESMYGVVHTALSRCSLETAERDLIPEVLSWNGIRTEERVKALCKQKRLPCVKEHAGWQSEETGAADKRLSECSSSWTCSMERSVRTCPCAVEPLRPELEETLGVELWDELFGDIE